MAIKACSLVLESARTASDCLKPLECWRVVLASAAAAAAGWVANGGSWKRRG